MAECQVERTVASHRDSIDRPIRPAWCNPVPPFDEREEFPDHEVLITILAVSGIDVKTGTGRRSGNQELLDFVFRPKIFDQIPGATVNEELVVVAQSVEKIENGEMPGLISIKRGGQKDAIGNRTREDLARQGIALNAAKGQRRERCRDEQRDTDHRE